MKAAKADDALALALLAKRNPVLVASEARAFDEGRVEGVQQAIAAVLQARGFPPTPAQRERIGACRDLGQLDRWLQRAARATAPHDVFDDRE